MPRVTTSAEGLLAVSGQALHDPAHGPIAPGEHLLELPIAVLKEYLLEERSRYLRAVSADQLWRRRGRFRVQEDIVSKDPRLAMEILRGVFVFRCEFVYADGVFEYEACSEHWGQVPPGLTSPWYECRVHVSPWRIEWVKRGDDHAKD